MKEWFTISELAAAGLPGLPKTESSLNNLALKKWRGTANLARKISGKTKSVWEYHISLLPPLARSRLTVLHGAREIEASTAEQQRAREAWERFEGLTDEQKGVCEVRLRSLLQVRELQMGGLTVRDAVARSAIKFDFCPASIFNWLRLVEGFDRSDWLAALAPSFTAGGHNKAECHKEAWTVLCSDYLRASGPAFSSCYRRMKQAAREHGWEPIPSERALRRRLEQQVPKAVQVLARAGKDQAKALYPAQRRDRSTLHAMEAVNMDGHKLDVFVQVPWKDKPVRLYLIAIQDLYSGKILSWRLNDAETWEVVRLVIGDMIENYGIPEKMVLDNGRAFASKWISGGTKTRFRFKVKQDDPQGLLTACGVELIWTQPYSGQSKPIERTWRDVAEAVSRHPFCAGAYTGNRPDAKPEDYGTRAIEYEAFKEHVAAQIAAVNAQEGRRAKNCNGRSFDATFAASLQADGTIVRQATAAQRALWLLASEAVKTRGKSGEIHFHGNRYWNKALNQYAGSKVTIRFDPDKLHQPVRVYDLDNRLICVADCIEDTGFHDGEAARRHAHQRKAYGKAVKTQKEIIALMSPDKLADIYGRVERAEAEKALKSETRTRPKITRLVQGNLAVKVENEFAEEEAFEADFSRAIARITGGAGSGGTDGAVVAFRQKE